MSISGSDAAMFGGGGTGDFDPAMFGAGDCISSDSGFGRGTGAVPEIKKDAPNALPCGLVLVLQGAVAYICIPTISNAEFTSQLS